MLSRDTILNQRPSMRNRTLVLVTYQFPYLPGEHFIETEIGYLADAFESVHIVPIRLAWSFGARTHRQRSIAAANVTTEAAPNRFTHFVHFIRATLAAPFLVAGYRRKWSGYPRIQDSTLSAWLRSAIKVSLARTALAQVARQYGTDTVYYSYWGLEAASALALLKESGVITNFFCRCHRIDVYIDGRYPFEDIIHEQSSQLFPVSDDGAAFFKDKKGFPQQNIAVQRLGVRLPAVVSRHSADGVLRILSCSNLIAVKRVQMIARFLAQLPGKLEWVHFGEGPERAQVEEIIRGFGRDKTAILKGTASNNAIYQYYEEHPVDLFVNLSESEGVPVSIMEALAFGVPVIATSVGGTPEIVDDTCGFLLDKECGFADFRKALVCLTSPDALAFRTAARLRAEVMCDAKSNYEGTACLMRTIAARQPPSRGALHK